MSQALHLQPCFVASTCVWCCIIQIKTHPGSLCRTRALETGDIGRLWPYSLFLRFEVKKIGSQVTKCAWSPTPVTQKWCVPFVVACDPIRARSIIFEGSLAEKFGFWVSKLHFWRKSRRKASFKGFEATWFLFIYLSTYWSIYLSILSYLILSYLSIFLIYLSLYLYLSRSFYLVISLSHLGS